MEQSLSNAFSILIVGMATVFLILWLVVVIGNLIIRITNKWAPEPENKQKGGNSNTPDSGDRVAAIVAAVEAITGGKGKVTKITKV